MTEERSLVSALGFAIFIVFFTFLFIAFVFAVLIGGLLFGGRALDSVRAQPVEAGCETELGGPAALVAFDPANGELEWIRHVGHSRVIEIAPPMIELESALDAQQVVRRSLNVQIDEFTTCTEDQPLTEKAAMDSAPPFELALQDFDHVETGLKLRITNERHQSTIDAYEASGGSPRWTTTVPVDGWSATAAAGSATTVIAAAGTEVTLLDAATGEVVWTADHGSPGEGGFFDFYNEPGSYRQFWYDADLDQYIGLIRAAAPDRD